MHLDYAQTSKMSLFLSVRWYDEHHMDGLYITRKRKKWKFHHFNEWPNCWQAEEITKKDVTKFCAKHEVVLEIGAGTANLSLELARRYPQKAFIACDIKSDRLYKAAKTALSEKVENIRFMRTNIRQITERVLPECADIIWITFPDPFPRKRSAKHRLTHPFFLQMYREMLKPNGVLNFKTDNQKLFDWSLEQFDEFGMTIKVMTRDLHTSNLPDDYKIITDFERRFMNEGLPIYFVQATFS